MTTQGGKREAALLLRAGERPLRSLFELIDSEILGLSPTVTLLAGEVTAGALCDLRRSWLQRVDSGEGID